MSPEPEDPPSTLVCERRFRAATGQDPHGWRAVSHADLSLVSDGSRPRRSTTIRVCWDERYLRVLFEVEDDEIHAPHHQRDDPVYEADAVELFLDPWGTGGRAYLEIDVSPRGVVFDALVLNRTEPDAAHRDITTLAGWDCAGLERLVRHSDGAQYGDLESELGSLDAESIALGYVVELALPLASLAPRGGGVRAGERWSFNAYRIDRSVHGDQYQAWRPTGRVDFHRPETFGQLHFVD